MRGMGRKEGAGEVKGNERRGRAGIGQRE